MKKSRYHSKYINYTVVPSTTFNDEKKKAYLEIDADERKQFYISRINVEGVGAPPRQQVLDELALRPGDIYNSRLWNFPYKGLPQCSRSVFAAPTKACSWTNERGPSQSRWSLVLVLDDKSPHSKCPGRVSALIPVFLIEGVLLCR